jgi:hypothetical protein
MKRMTVAVSACVSPPGGWFRLPDAERTDEYNAAVLRFLGTSAPQAAGPGRGTLY